MVKVDLTKKPYFLEKEDIQWVEDTIAEMTTEEKIGQRVVICSYSSMTRRKIFLI